MCISADASLKVFTGTSVILFILNSLGHKKYANFNMFFSLTIMYVVLIQLIDYFIWIDIDCKKGYNKLSTFLGPIVLFTQPLFIYLLSKIIYPNKKLPKIIHIINLLYLIYLLFNLKTKWGYGNCTKISKDTGHLEWKWQIISIFYFSLIAINFLSIENNIYGHTAIWISLILYILTFVFKRKNAGELWCFSVILLPIIIFCLQLLHLN